MYPMESEWASNISGISLPRELALRISEIITKATGRSNLYNVAVNEKTRELYLEEYRHSGKLGTTSAVSYLLYPEGLGAEDAGKISDIFSETGINITDYVNARLRYTVPVCR